MRKQRKRMLAFLLTLAVIMGYMPISTVQAEAASGSVKSLKLSKTQYVLKKGKTVKLKATVSPKTAKVTWKSSNTAVATVSSKGVVKAVASKGKATITAKCGKKKATCKITIGTPVKKISAMVLPKNAKVKTLSYESKNKSIATVNKSGKVTGKKSGKAKIVITAKDCGKVKKTITVNVVAKEDVKKPTQVITKTPDITKAPTVTPTPDITKAPIVTPTPKGELTLEKQEVTIKVGESYTPEYKVVSDNPKDEKVNWISSDSNVAAVIGSDGTIQALTPGECVITVTSGESSWITASYKVTVSEEVQKTVTTQEELEAALTSAEASVITLDTKAEEINIPSGDYSSITLVVNAPQAHIVNEGIFKNVLIKGISENTWVERYGNEIFINSANGHILVDEGGNPNVYLLDDSEKITVTNNGDLQELLIASAAKVLIKGDSIASRVGCHVINDGSYLTTYVPLDIYSITTYQLAVGPGGEQTAIKVDSEDSIPQISGIGTLSVTIDSTGENKTIIAENDGSVADLPTAQLSGHIVTEETAVKNAKVYLVSYSKKVDGDNISVYLNGASTKKTTTDEEGAYSFVDVTVGNYIIVVEAEGYELITQNIYIPTTYAESTYEVEDIILMSEAGETGAITGIVYNAETGEVITEGMTVFLRKGMNNITSTEVQKVITDSTGKYEFLDVVPGQYTIQIRDERKEAVYVSDYYNISVLSGTMITKNITLSKRLNSQELRFVLTWAEKGENVSEDLDILLYAPYPYEDTEYEIHFGSYTMYHSGYDMNFNYYGRKAVLDVDDKEYAGPETITVKQVESGQYKIFVQDYTNGGTGNGLTNSKPEVKVYKGNTLLETFKMPEKTGGVWYVCNYDGKTGKLTAVNDVYSGQPNETTKAQIGKIFNQLEQFEIIDAAAFAQDKSLMDTIKEAYLKEQDEVVLTSYLQQLEELLNKLKDGLTMTKITGVGLEPYSFYGFETSHSITSLRGATENIPEVNVEFADAESDTSHLIEPLQIDSGIYKDYKLTLKNHTLGVSTAYQVRYYQRQETPSSWVISIEDPDNEEWKTSYSLGATSEQVTAGGLNKELGRNLEIKLEDGIELKSIEYKEDLKEDWTYDERYAAVLHLEKTETGATKDCLIHYIPTGAELLDITDSENIIVDLSLPNTWDCDRNTYTVEMYGENKEIGSAWKPVVREGATYSVLYPEDIEDENFDAQARVIVTYINGAEKTYDIYYYQDTAAAEIIGIRDVDNMYTNYSTSTLTYSNGRVNYNIHLSGMNSNLGTDLKVYTKNGATAEIEYATASESFEVNSSDAKITVTAANGAQRIYYIIYSKSDENLNLRGIDSAANELKKVYVSYQTIYITGTKEALGDDLELKTNEGYEASYNSEDDEIILTETQTGEQTVYDIHYTQDTSGVNLKKIISESQPELTCKIGYYLQKVTTSEDKEEQFYLVELVGDSKECPTDLKLLTEYGNEVEITYAALTENWIYPEEYSAKILLKDATGFSKMYLVTYKQDESKTVVKGITDKNNVYADTDIFSYKSSIDKEDGTREQVYNIYVIGEKETLGDTYELSLSSGTKIASRIKAGEEGWDYKPPIASKSYTVKETGQSLWVEVICTEKVIVEAANGAQRVYMIYYGQDESGAAISNITDEENTYLEEVSIETDHYFLNFEEPKDDISGEKVYMIYVSGSNAELGNTYQLEIPKGSKIASTLHAGEEGWNYQKTISHSSYVGESYVTRTYTMSERVVIQAANGAERVYVIAYLADTSGAVISNITDEENTYTETVRIDQSSRELYFEEPKDDILSEEVYMIYVCGGNKTLGTTYQLTIPESSSIVEKVSVGEEGWNYGNYSKYSYFEDENGANVYVYYLATDRVVIQAANGVKRVYVIAYAQDDRGTQVAGITDEYNQLNSSISIAERPITLTVTTEDGESEEKEVYVIGVVGGNKELGSTYELTIPEGSKIVSTNHSGTEAWKYEEESTYVSYVDALGNYKNEAAVYTDEVVIQAPNGAERTYLIAYAQVN